MSSGRWRRWLGGGFLILGVLFIVVAAGGELYDRWQGDRGLRLAMQNLAATDRPADLPRPTLFIPTPTPAPTLIRMTQTAPEILPQSAMPGTPASPVSSPTPGPASLPATPAPAVASGQLWSDRSSRPTRLVIPFLNMDVPVEEMGWRVVETANGAQSEWTIPEYAAGYHANSAQVGEGDNVVISGHNNIYGRVFEPISLAFDPNRPDAYIGQDVELVTDGGQVVIYRIERVQLIQEAGVSLEQRLANAQVMAPTGKETLTIITCWPMTSNTHRIVLQAVPT